MGKRRSNNEGTIFRRGDGRWTASISLEGGKRKSYYGKTRGEVAGKLNTALKAKQDGLPLVGERQKTGGFLWEWLDIIKPSLRPGSWQRYEQMVRIHLTPQIGHIALARLTPGAVQRLYANRLEAGLSSTSVHHLHAFLHSALDHAARWGLVARNVTDLVRPPRISRKEMTTLSPEQTRAFLRLAAGEPHEALYVLAITTGMRQGELLALRWRDVDLDRGSLRVVGTMRRITGGFAIQEPKTPRSRRQLSLGAVALSALKGHRTRQLEKRLGLGSAWHDDDLVFANEVGRPIEVGNLLRRSFWPLLGRAHLPRIRFHDLRHTAATLMLGKGVHPKVVSEMLGHAQVAVTLDLYSHVTPNMQQAAVAAIDEILAE